MKNLNRFEQFADGFEQLPMYFMTFHGQENTRRVIEVRRRHSTEDSAWTVKFVTIPRLESARVRPNKLACTIFAGWPSQVNSELL